MKKILLSAVLAATAFGAYADTTTLQTQEFNYGTGAPTIWGDFVGGNPASVILNFAAFDTTLGTLDSVSAILFGKVISSVAVNAVTNTPLGTNITTGASILVISGPANTTNQSVDITATQKSPALTAGDSTVIDFGTLLGQTTLNVANTTGPISFSLAGLGSNGCSTVGGNAGCDFTTLAGAKIELAYNYTPTAPQPVPEPASLALVGLALAGLAVGRKSRKA